MASEWCVGDFLDGLKTQLEARAALAGVDVWTAHPSAQTDTSDRIILATDDITGVAPWAAQGRLRRNDTFTIPCRIAVVRPGAGETVAKACRDRIEVLFVEVLEQLKNPPAVGQQTVEISDITYKLAQGALEDSPNERAAVLDFSFSATVRVT